MERPHAPSRLRLALLVTAGVVALPACSPAPGDPGTRLYLRHCAPCHGSDGAARTRYARGRPHTNLVDGIWKHPSDPASMRRLVLEGEPGSPMPPFAGKLSVEEADAVVRHVRTLAAPRGPR